MVLDICDIFVAGDLDEIISYNLEMGDNILEIINENVFKVRVSLLSAT
jgi:hypothetical protein